MANRYIPFGYEIQNAEIVIVNQEALLVKSAFELYIAGKSYKMIADREKQIAALQQKIDECREFDRVSKEKRKSLRKTSEVIEEIIDEGRISDAHLRMLVRKVTIHQNEDKSLDINFEMNGNWNGSVAVYVSLDDD